MINKESQVGFKKSKFFYNTIIIVGGIIIILFLFFFVSIKFLSLTQKEDLDYKKIDENIYVKGKVSNVYEDKGYTFIMLSDSMKIWLPHSRNYYYEYPYLNGFMLTGDSIEKEPNNDTLKIYRKSKQYYFVLGKYINQSKSGHSNE